MTTCLLDVGPAVHQRAGLSRYAERLASGLLDQSLPNLSVALFYNQHSGHAPPPTLYGAPTYSISAGQYQWRLSALASQRARVRHRGVSAIVNSLRASTGASHTVVYHATEHLLPRLRCPTVLTVHDLIFDRLPEFHTRLNRLFLRVGMPLFVRDATLVIAVSHRTKADLAARYSLDESRIRVVYEGIDSEFAPASAEQDRLTRDNYSAGAPFLLMVGAIEPRKNHIGAMQALEHLHRAGYPHNLLIAGGRGWMDEPIVQYAESHPLAARIRLLGYVPQQDLTALYSAADCVLLPSYYEGFGFTALEAMACGTPVICSKVGSLPEIAGRAALYVDPDDIEGLAQSVRNVIDQPPLARAMVRLGREHARGFRWDSCARETAEIYREAGRLALK